MIRLITFIERKTPFVVALFTSFSFYFLFWNFIKVNIIVDKIFGNMLTVSTAMVGFFMAIITIIHTIDSRRMKFVRESGKYSRLIKYAKTAIQSNLLVITIALFQTIFTQIYIPKLNSVELEGIRIFFSLLIFIVFFAWTSGARFSVIFLMLLADPEEKKDS